MSEFLDAWITGKKDTVVGLCGECHRTYGHDDDCRVGEIVRLKSLNAELLEALEQIDYDINKGTIVTSIARHQSIKQTIRKAKGE